MITNFLANKLLDHTFGLSSYTTAPPYVALFTAEPDYALGTGGTEVTGGSYARAYLGTPTLATLAHSENFAQVTFATASADWGLVVAAALMNAASAGNMLWGAPITAHRQVLNGDRFYLGAGDIDLTFVRA